MSSICSVKHPKCYRMCSRLEFLWDLSHPICASVYSLAVWQWSAWANLFWGPRINLVTLPGVHGPHPDLGVIQECWETGELDVYQFCLLGKPIFLSLYVKYGWKVSPDLSLEVYAVLKCSSEEAWLEQFWIDFYRTRYILVPKPMSLASYHYLEVRSVTNFVTLGSFTYL